MIAGSIAVQLFLFVSYQATDIDPKTLAALSGTVTGVGGHPLSKSTVSLRRLGEEQETYKAAAIAVSNGDGKFSFEGIPPGTYVVVADHRGYLSGTPGRKRTTQELTGFTPIPLAAGQEVRDISIELIPASSISGKVVDQDGEPVAKAYAHVFTFTYRYGERTRRYLVDATTDDRGEFRISGLGPGSIYLDCMPDPIPRMISTNGNDSNIKSSTPNERELTTYYPGVPDIKAATSIKLIPGQEVSGIILQITRSRVYHLRGQIGGAVPAGLLRVEISNPDGTQSSSRVIKGRFDVADVPPGDYTIALEGSNNKGSLLVEPFRMLDHDTEVVLNVLPQATLSGKFKIEGAGDQIKTVSLSKTEIFLESPGRRQYTNPSEDGSFTIPDLRPATFPITFDGLPEGSYPKSISFGGQEFLGRPLDLSGGAGGATLEVVLSMASAEISGNVTLEKEETIGGTVVVLVPDTPQPQNNWKYKRAGADVNGNFTIHGVAPGNYRLFAAEQLERGVEFDPDWLNVHGSRGIKVSLDENDRKQFTLKRISIGELQDDELHSRR